MTTHDVLAYAVASEAVRHVRSGELPWGTIFSPAVYVTASRAWPMPDFVLMDDTKHVSAAAEFKPPDQTKREYLTGLGQALAYSRAFNYAFLVVPQIADDGFPIARFIADVLDQPSFSGVPVGVLSYDPAIISPSAAGFSIARFMAVRAAAPPDPAHLDNSFYAKWREISPAELGVYLDHLYEEARHPSSTVGSIRNRAFDHLWADLQAGLLRHWAGGVRHAKADTKNKEAWRKNYRNFVSHIGWMDSEGRLTDDGLRALHTKFRYGADAVIFSDSLANALLNSGKHLVLLNAINDIQDSYYRAKGSFPSEQKWLDHLETELEDKGLLKRNPGRAGAAVSGSKRQFLKAEKQLWKNLGLIVLRGKSGGRVYHAGRGFLINWTRVTELLNSQ